MVTKVKAERARLREAFGEKCYLCGYGPLLRRAMHVVNDRRVADVTVPMCLHCRNLMQEADLEKAVFRAAKRHARAFDKLADVAINAGLRRFPAAPKGIIS